MIALRTFRDSVPAARRDDWVVVDRRKSRSFAAALAIAISSR